MRILILTNSVRPDSGWGRYASDLISGLRKTGHKVVILKEENDGCEGLPILKRGLGLFYSAFKTRMYIKNCDVIQAVDINPCAIIAWLANLGINKPLIVTALGTYSIAPFRNITTRWLAHSVCRSASSITAISGFTGEKLSALIGCNVQVITPGIDLKKFRLNHETSEKNYVLSVGALKYRKGYHVSIPAFAKAKKKNPDLKYIIVGNQKDKNYFKQIKSLAELFNVQDSVQFLENVSREQLDELYRKAKVFVLTSVNEAYHFEGYGLVFLEAAAAGLPVIGTKGNGIEDAVKDGYNGILVNQNNVEETAMTIIEILGNENKWQTMSKNSYDWAEKNNIGQMTERFIEIYNELAD